MLATANSKTATSDRLRTAKTSETAGLRLPLSESGLTLSAGFGGRTLEIHSSDKAPTFSAAMQGSIGNQAVLRSIQNSPPAIQPKLAINQPGDAYEQEADRIADQVVRASVPVSVQRRCAACDQETKLQRKCAHCAEEELQRKCARCEQEGNNQVHRKDTGAGSAPQIVHETLRSPGRPLDASTRAFFEPRFGHDFSHVRVHADSRAAESAQSVNALAYTVGNNIVFGSGQLQPSSAKGRQLLAHELVHVVQNNPVRLLRATTSGAPARVPSPEVCTPPRTMDCPTGASPATVDRAVTFAQDSATLDSTQKPIVDAAAAAWHTAGASATVRIDGYASADGPCSYNWDLSCRRAHAVAAELQSPVDRSPGVSGASINLFAHGESDEAGPTLGPNRRATITIVAPPPAPAPAPACTLAVTGPHTVDHYCSAYVPSDAVSCGTFPAPNIVLTATGAAAGAALTWSIINGAANASIAGPANNASVTIQGSAASAARDDVTIQVTDGHCTATHLVTVRQPSRMTASEAARSTPTVIEDIVTYTVQDQFGDAMGAGICLDETVSVCASSVAGAAFHFGDAPTNAAGQQTDNLRATFPAGIPADLCVKLDQTITAGGCGPLLHNTILYRPTGITLTHGAGCAAGDPCP